MTASATSPPDVDLWELFRQWGGLALLAPVAGWLAGQWRAWRRRRERRAELLEAIAEHVSLSADLERFRFEYEPKRETFEDHLDHEARERWEGRGGIGQTPREQWESLKVRNRESRERLWRARGFPGAPPEPEAREWHEERVRVLRQLKQTQRWKAQEAEPKEDSTT